MIAEEAHDLSFTTITGPACDDSVYIRIITVWFHSVTGNREQKKAAGRARARS